MRVSIGQAGDQKSPDLFDDNFRMMISALSVNPTPHILQGARLDDQASCIHHDRKVVVSDASTDRDARSEDAQPVLFRFHSFWSFCWFFRSVRQKLTIQFTKVRHTLTQSIL